MSRRRVKVFKQVKKEHSKEEIEAMKKESGRNPNKFYWVPEFSHTATFVEYGLDIEEGDAGLSLASCTCAVVELDNGKVELVPVDLIEFSQNPQELEMPSI